MFLLLPHIFQCLRKVVILHPLGMRAPKLAKNISSMKIITKSEIRLVRSLQLKKFRDEHGLFVAEGRKCVSELLGSFDLELLAVSDDAMSDMPQVGGQELSDRLVMASNAQMEQMSSLRSPQGVLAVFRQRSDDTAARFGMHDTSINKESKLKQNHEFIIALDGVQDPGNLGTILRTADWFGVRRVVCSPDTADCYNPKVVQATMGALARVRVGYADLEDFIRHCDLPVYGTLLDGRNIYEEGAITQDGTLGGVIVMGNEGNGISARVRRLITRPLLIPSYPPGATTSESLNVAVATAVVLAEFRRRAAAAL